MSAPLITEVRRRTARLLKTRSIREVLNGATGAIDLASILVGVIVLGVVGGIIATSVFAVIPWAQNSAARADLDAVNTAESAVFALGSADGNAKYLTMDGLLDYPSGPMIQSSDRVAIGVGDDDQCYVAISQSHTGERFFITNTNPAVRPYETGSTLTSCLNMVELKALEDQLPNVGDDDSELSVPTGGLMIDSIRNKGGDYRGRVLWLEHDGAWDEADFPYAAEPAVVAAEDSWATDIVDVKAWIDGVQVPVTLNSSNSDLYWSATGNYPYAELDVTDFVVGDNTNATLRAFANGGILSFRVDGSNSVNVFRMDASYNIGDTLFPEELDGTLEGGDIAPPIKIHDGKLPSVVDGDGYYKQLDSDTPGAQWSIESGDFPPGLVLSGSGEISGTPITPGDYAFVVRADDGAGGVGTKELTIYVQGEHAPINLVSVAENKISGSLLAVDSDGFTWTWGGYGPGPEIPTRDLSIPAFTKFEVADYGVGIDSSGNLWTWGYNWNGQLGNGTVTPVDDGPRAPAQITTGTKFVDVAAGVQNAIALDEDGNVWTWGSNQYGQLGNGTASGTMWSGQVTVPTKIISPRTYKAVEAGDNTSYAIASDGAMYGWGNGLRYALGDGNNSYSTVHTPKRIGSGLYDSVSSSPQSYWVAALTTVGKLHVWGYEMDNTSRPVEIAGNVTFSQAVAGRNSGIAIDTGGNVFTWGTIHFYSTVDGSSWVPVPGYNARQLQQATTGQQFKSVAASDAMAAVDTSGRLWTWGRSSLGSGVEAHAGMLTPTIVDSRFWFMK